MKTILCVTLLSITLAFAGCESMGPNAEHDAVMGGLGGAALGGVIGAQSHRALEGAAIGGALGSVAGAAWGDARDQRETAAYRDYYYDHYTRPAYYGYQYAQPVAPAPVDYSYAVPAGYHYNYYYPTYYGYGYYPSTRQAVYAIPCEY